MAYAAAWLHIMKWSIDIAPEMNLMVLVSRQ